MTPQVEATTLRKITGVLCDIEAVMACVRQIPGISDETSDLLGDDLARLAVIISALNLQAEILDPTPRRTIKELDAGKSAPAVRDD